MNAASLDLPQRHGSRVAYSAHRLGRQGRAERSGIAAPTKRELRLHAAEWDAVEMALSAYVARIGDVFSTVDASGDLPTAMASTVLTALRLATRTVMSLHGAIDAAREKCERADQWKRRRKGGAGAPARILVRHQALELVPSLLEDFAAQLMGKGHEEASIAFVRLGKAIGAAFP